MGELIPLDEQDRALWDRNSISEGTALVEQAMAAGRVGPYQVQAAIAALHDQAPATERADWPQIHALYRVLESMNDNPVVTLNRAIAAAMVEGPEAGLQVVDAVAKDERMKYHYRVHAVRAHLLERAGRKNEALASYQRAAEMTASVPERNYLVRKIARLRS
jgi:predicted RNA polymerase sigma factor